MTVSLDIRHHARIDLLAHLNYLAERNPDVAPRFYKAVRGTYEQLLQNPQLGELYHWSDGRYADVRLLTVTGFSNYIVFYRECGSQVDIMRLLHGSQNWQNALFD